MTGAKRPLVTGLAVAGLVVVLTQFFPGAWPIGFVAQGAVTGCQAGLLALGLVLTYRTSRIIDFSYGALGGFSAEIGVFAYQRFHVPWLLCIPIAIAAGVGCGAAVERLLRRFVNAPRLIVTVATIGLLQVFVGLQFLLPYLGRAPLVTIQVRTLLSNFHFSIGHGLFYGNDVLAVAVVPVVLIGLSWFLLGTESGTAVRAIAENPERAMLLGIPVHRLSRLVWMIVGAVSAGVMVLNAPSNGLPVDPFVGVGSVFMPALAAAVVAKMESLPTAFVTGVGLGVAQSVIAQNINKQALGTVLFWLVILAALLLRRWNMSRAETAGESSVLAGAGRRLPPEVASLPEVVYGRWALLVLIAAAAVAFPYVAHVGEVHTYSGYLVLGVVILSIVVLAGWSGTISFGQFAIAGVGAVAAGDVMVKANLDLTFALIVAAGAGAVVALLLALPALRVKPLFLAVTTIAFADAMAEYFLNPANYPNWIPSDIPRPVLWKRFPLHSERAMYFLCLGLLVVTILVVRALRSGRPGRVLLASRDNPRAAAAMAVSVTRVRISGMIMAGMLAGVAGAVYAILQNAVGYEGFDTQTSITLFSMAVVGGLGSVSGSLCGLAVTEAILAGLGVVSSQAASLAPLATGTLLLGVLVVVPGGVGQGIEWVRDRLVQRLAARRGIVFEVGAAAGSVGAEVAADASAPQGGAAGPSGPSGREAVGASPILACHDLTASYGPLQVLFGVDLEVAEGEIVALLGTNGAGKSTLLKALTGLLPPTGGTVDLDGVAARGRAPYEIACQGLAMMPGGRGVFPTLTVAENLRLSTWQLRADRSVAAAARAEMMDLFPILGERQSQMAGNLSGGEQQQLSLAMAFVTKPRVLCIDELSLGLAPTVVSQLCDKVREIHAGGTTIVVVEQSVNVALMLAQRAVFLEKGRVRFEGPTADLLDRPDVLRSVFIGAGRSAAGDSGSHGRSSPARRSRPAGTERNDRGVALSCHGIVKRFGGITAVDHTDLTVPPGRIVGLIGHNGAGKTTLFDVISGFLPPEQGRVRLGGQDITDWAPHRRAALGLGRSFQEATLYPSLTVIETIVVALDRHLACRDPWAASLALPAAVQADAAAYERAYELIDLLGLGGFAETPNSDLSTGTRRIVELACVVGHDPAVVLLDEPSAGVAQKETEALGPLLRQVQSETGCAICVIEHDMGLMTSLCDELVALELGAVIAQGPPGQVLSDRRVIESYLGTDEDAIARSGARPPQPVL